MGGAGAALDDWGQGLLAQSVIWQLTPGLHLLLLHSSQDLHRVLGWHTRVIRCWRVVQASGGPGSFREGSSEAA